MTNKVTDVFLSTAHKTANKCKTIQDKTADCCRSLERNCVFIELSIRDLNTVKSGII